MMSLTDDKQVVIIEAFNSIFKYLDDLLNIDYPYHEGLVTQIYPAELQLNANSIDTEKGKKKVQGVPQSQTAAIPRPQEEEETDKSNQAQIEQTYEKH